MELKIKIHDKDSIIPEKAGDNEVGYDLTAISFVKKLSPVTFMYDTGISVKPPDGYYTEIIPRSSIVKSGFILANSIGIIDPTYRGTLKIVLHKVDTGKKESNNQLSARPLTVPFTLCQLVVRKMEKVKITVVDSLDDTYRGDGGFGSTNKK
ncbi:MAG TPA: dUTP pyrophosphatase [Flavobacteriales bacterium]|nr:dUTP pyrophosphatase [Flavobacteriales bacterium]